MSATLSIIKALRLIAMSALLHEVSALSTVRAVFSLTVDFDFALA
jgi:hypothetical protein